MDNFKIEKGVPVPEKINIRGVLSGVLRNMKIGDSILVPLRRHSGIGVLAERAWGKKSYRMHVESNTHFRPWRVR